MQNYKIHNAQIAFSYVTKIMPVRLMRPNYRSLGLNYKKNHYCEFSRWNLY